jgi:hypothetical protein
MYIEVVVGSEDTRIEDMVDSVAGMPTILCRNLDRNLDYTFYLCPILF